jgi:uncharacterized integral membrane protein
MFTCPPNLTHSFHTVCKIIRFKVEKKKFFSQCLRGTVEFWGPKKPFFRIRMDWRTSNSCSWISYVHVHKISFPHKAWNLEKIINFHKGVCWNSHTKAVFGNKNSIWKILELKIQMVEICSNASSTHTNFYFWKILKSWFLVRFQSFVFGQILANIVNFGQFWAVLDRFFCIGSGWQHARTLAEILKTS